jgi:hypothetical protein
VILGLCGSALATQELQELLPNLLHGALECLQESLLLGQVPDLRAADEAGLVGGRPDPHEGTLGGVLGHEQCELDEDEALVDDLGDLQAGTPTPW